MINDVAMGNSNFERIEADFYPTPPIVTKVLLPFLQQPPFNLSRNNVIWECACGTGIMSEVIKQDFDEVISTDLNWYGYGYPGIDFYKCEMPYSSVIITNPPYGNDAEKFIRKGLELTQPYNGILALLLRKEYDSAVTRNDLFNKESPFAMKIDLLWRPIWFPEDERQDANPRHNFSWFVWSWNHIGQNAFLCYADKPNRRVTRRKRHA